MAYLNALGRRYTDEAVWRAIGSRGRSWAEDVGLVFHSFEDEAVTLHFESCGDFGSGDEAVCTRVWFCLGDVPDSGAHYRGRLPIPVDRTSDFDATKGAADRWFHSPAPTRTQSKNDRRFLCVVPNDLVEITIIWSGDAVYSVDFSCDKALEILDRTRIPPGRDFRPLAGIMWPEIV